MRHRGGVEGGHRFIKFPTWREPERRLWGVCRCRFGFLDGWVEKGVAGRRWVAFFIRKQSGGVHKTSGWRTHLDKERVISARTLISAVLFEGRAPGKECKELQPHGLNINDRLNAQSRRRIDHRLGYCKIFVVVLLQGKVKAGRNWNRSLLRFKIFLWKEYTYISIYMHTATVNWNIWSCDSWLLISPSIKLWSVKGEAERKLLA